MNLERQRGGPLGNSTWISRSNSSAGRHDRQYAL